MPFIPDGNGDGHTYFEAADVVYHWDTVSQNRYNPFQVWTREEDILAPRQWGSSAGNIHLLWQATDPKSS